MLNDNKSSPNCQTVVWFSVYTIWCRVTNQYYVGITSQKVKTRIHQHKHGKQFVDREIQRLGWEGNFDYWVVEEGVTPEQISDCEKKWIKFFDCVHPKGYNKTHGGLSHIIVSDDTRNQRRQIGLARDISGKNNPNCKPGWNKGIPHTREHNAKISAAQKGEKANMYGKHQTEAAKEKIRQGNLGKEVSEKTKALLRQRALAREARKRAAKAAETAEFAKAAAEAAKGTADAQAAQAVADAAVVKAAEAAAEASKATKVAEAIAQVFEAATEAAKDAKFAQAVAKVAKGTDAAEITQADADAAVAKAAEAAAKAEAIATAEAAKSYRRNNQSHRSRSSR